VEVIACYSAAGSRWQMRINEDLKKLVARKNGKAAQKSKAP
jgi:uncharacterized protein (DUF4415 family)